MSERVVDISKLTYTYPGRGAPTLRDVDLAVDAGEFILLSGPTGCGKSTLLRAVNGIIPHDAGGTLAGSVSVAGRDTREADLAWLASHAGLVFQSPEDQVFHSRLADEVAFGLENLRVASDEIARRVAWALDEVGLADVTGVPVAELSGGQKQRLAIASVIAMRPQVLLLDEPLSQLDPAGAEQVLDVIARLRRDLNIAIVLVEHRMQRVVELADRVVLMDGGRIVRDAPTARAFDDLDVYRRLGLRLPESIELMDLLGRDERPLTGAEAATILADVPASPAADAPGGAAREGEALVDMAHVSVRYTRRGPDVLRDVSLRVTGGDVVAVMGANGSGKSTLLYALLGELRLSAGRGTVSGEDMGRRRRRAASVGMLFQSPELMLLADTVREEVTSGPVNLGLDEAAARERADAVMRAMGIDALADEPPLGLSRGQRLRVALASVLSMEPALLLLDEPTSGQDRDQVESMMDHLTEGLDGRAVIFCTHDMAMAARYATVAVVLSAGRVVACGTPAQVFSDDGVLARAGLHPPPAVGIAKRLGLVGVTTIDELARRLAKGGPS